MSTTNDLTTKIIGALFSAARIFSYRQNVLGVPISVSGQVVGYRPPPTTGIPDIQVVVPRGKSSLWPNGSGFLGIEVKNSLTKDKIRPSQTAFHANARAGGDAQILTVHNYPDFLAQILPILDLLSLQEITNLTNYGLSHSKT